MTRALVLAVSLLVGGCDKGDTAKPKAAPAAASPSAGEKGSDGLRHIAIEVNKEGYTPSTIAGKPDEKLVLTFTRTADSTCIAQVKVPDGSLVDLPLNKPVDVPVTVPKTGQVGFACGMDMFHGVVVAQPST